MTYFDMGSALGRITTFVNPYSYMLLSKYLSGKPEDIFDIYYDGISLVVLSNLLCSAKTNRFSFDDSSLAPVVFQYAKNNSKTVAFVGSTRDVIDKASIYIRSRYSGIMLDYISDGYFDVTAEAKVLKNCMSADIVICSMGTPKQEDFLVKLREKGWLGTGFTCGGYFDQLVLSKGNDYYPKWVDKLNLRWLYRLFKEPRRLWKRYLIGNPLFIWRVIKQKFGYF